MSAWIMVYTVTSLFLWKDPYHTSEQGLFQNFCCITKYHTGMSVLRAILNKLAIAVKHRFHQHYLDSKMTPRRAQSRIDTYIEICTTKFRNEIRVQTLVQVNVTTRQQWVINTKGQRSDRSSCATRCTTCWVQTWHQWQVWMAFSYRCCRTYFKECRAWQLHSAHPPIRKWGWTS